MGGREALSRSSRRSREEGHREGSRTLSSHTRHPSDGESRSFLLAKLELTRLYTSQVVLTRLDREDAPSVKFTLLSDSHRFFIIALYESNAQQSILLSPVLNQDRLNPSIVSVAIYALLRKPERAIPLSAATESRVDELIARCIAEQEHGHEELETDGLEGREAEGEGGGAAGGDEEHDEERGVEGGSQEEPPLKKRRA